MRFTDFIDAHDAVEDVVNRFPQTENVFAAYGVRRICWHCDIRQVAERGELDLSRLLAELNRAAFGAPQGQDS